MSVVFLSFFLNMEEARRVGDGEGVDEIRQSIITSSALDFPQQVRPKFDNSKVFLLNAVKRLT